ncbi:MAG TPA: AAA family ATPase, partial [Pyrinomonadaceae bacterium]
MTERPLTAQRLAQYVARGRCERHLRFALFPTEALGLLRRYGLEIEPLSPLLSSAGQAFEREQFEELSARARVLDLQGQTPEAFVEELRRLPGAPAGPTFFYQPSMRAPFGAWACEGRADLVRVERDAATGRVEATVIDIKASRRETVGFRLQVAFYARLLRGALADAGLTPAAIHGAIAARDSELTDDGGWETFDLALYSDEVERLVAAADSDVARAAAAGPHGARYHLRAACDGCPYNQLCFADTAERLDLSLVPHLTISEKRALHAAGVGDARELAALMEYGEGGAMVVSAGAEARSRVVASRWPLASRLPVLVQRARAAARRFDRATAARRYLVGSDYGSLPDPAQYPDLVRVFVDAQRDYLEDRLYLIGARVTGPRASFEVIEMTDAPPDLDSERALLVAWVQNLLPAVARAAESERAPLHVYTYAARGERTLLDALARHFDALCAIPAFYDLLTSRPALSQGMLSLLSEEVRARLNLPPVCQNLYEVARELGFKWEDGPVDFRKIFRARVFDNRRTFVRDAAAGVFTKDAARAVKEDEAGAVNDDEEDAPPEPHSVRVESAARFGVEIPLEYAYAAWGRLREPEASATQPASGRRSPLRGFVGVSAEEIRALEGARLRAMQHVEESFAYKNRRVEKEPLDLSGLDRVDVEPEEVPLRRSLEDFLLLEHHARFQDLLLHLALPPRQRAETGRTLMLRCERYLKDEDGERAHFRFADADTNDADGTEADGVVAGDADADPPPQQQQQTPLRVRAGDWVVVNPSRDGEGRALPAWRLVRGRLAVVEELSASEVALRLLPMSFKNSPFRYPHVLFKPEPGVVYTADEMADDLNSDKFLEACRNAATNHLYRWLSDMGEGKRARAVRPRRLRDAEAMASLASAAQSPHGLTGAQREIVGGHLCERVLVVQGPPGTGKSHTLGFAILARALAQTTPARPFRVAVLAKTHAAVAVALESIAKRRRELTEAIKGDAATTAHPAAPLLAPLARRRLAKMCNDAGETVPAGVERVLPDGGDESTAAEQWQSLLTEELLVVGGTPGGLYRLVKLGASKGRAVDWAAEHFDLVVVDEASQMGLAEALTA